MSEPDGEWSIVKRSKDSKPKPATSKGGSFWHPNSFRSSLREKAESLLPKPAAFARLILSSPSTFVDASLVAPRNAPETTWTPLENTDPKAEEQLKNINLRYSMSPTTVDPAGRTSVKATFIWFDGKHDKTNHVEFCAWKSKDQDILSCTMGYPPGQYTEEVHFSLVTPLGKEALSALSNRTGGANASSTVDHHLAAAQTSRPTEWQSVVTNAKGEGSYVSGGRRQASGNPSSRSVNSQDNIRTGQTSAKNRRSTQSSQHQTNSHSRKSQKDPSRKGGEAGQINTSQIHLPPGYVLGLFRERTVKPRTQEYTAEDSLCFRGDSDMSHSQILCQRLLGISHDLVPAPQFS